MHAFPTGRSQPGICSGRRKGRVRQGVRAGSPGTPISSPTALFQPQRPQAPRKHSQDSPSPLPRLLKKLSGPGRSPPAARSTERPLPPTPGRVSPARRGRCLPRAPAPPPPRAPASRPAIPRSCSLPARPGRPCHRPPSARPAPLPCCPAQPPSTPDPEVPSPRLPDSPP